MEGNAGEHSAKLEISNGIVQLMSNHYGRGPNKAKTFVVDQYVLVVLEDLLTRAETTMVENGHADMVRDMRITFQADMADEFKEVVETALNRKVKTYQSQVVFDPPMGFEDLRAGGVEIRRRRFRPASPARSARRLRQPLFLRVPMSGPFTQPNFGYRKPGRSRV